MPRACALQQEKPPQWEAHAPQQRVAPARCNWRESTRRNENPTQPKKIFLIKIKKEYKKKKQVSEAKS